MLTFKVYDEKGKELLSKPINHFTERVRRDNELELSCLFRVLAKDAATAMDEYQAIVNIPIGKVAIFEDDTLIVEYDKYKTVSGVQLDYGPVEFSGTVTFMM